MARPTPTPRSMRPWPRPTAGATTGARACSPTTKSWPGCFASTRNARARGRSEARRDRRHALSQHGLGRRRGGERLSEIRNCTAPPWKGGDERGGCAQRVRARRGLGLATHPQPLPWQGGGLGRVHINKDQYFDGVPKLAWDFHIGGYQPAQKWLKDRRGRSLSFDDITHYQRIVKILRRKPTTS